MSAGLLAQEPTDTYQTTTEINDTTWKVETVEVYEINNVSGGVEYTDTYTVVDPAQTLYFDSTGIVDYLTTKALNAYNESEAKWRRAISYRKSSNVDNEYTTQIENLGGNLDSVRVELYGSRLKGRWKFIDNVGVERNFDLIAHPNRTDVLRMDEDGGLNENMNVTVDGLWSMTVRMNLQNVKFVWNNKNRERPGFYLDDFWKTGVQDNSRWVKID